MKKSLKFSILGVGLIIICISAFIGIKSYNINKSYQKYLNEASSNMNLEKYDNAITLYQEAEKYKNDPVIKQQIEMAKILKISKESYDNAIRHMDDKDYLAAIDTFKKVNKQDTKRYSDSQDKISTCKKAYIDDNLNTANDNLASSKFDDANNALNNIFKIDATNNDAIKVKDDIAKAIQKQKDDEEAKAKEVANAKVKTSTAPTVSSSNNTNSLYQVDRSHISLVGQFVKGVAPVFLDNYDIVAVNQNWQIIKYLYRKESYNTQTYARTARLIMDDNIAGIGIN